MRSLARVAALAALLACGGCAAGWVAVRPEAERAAGPAPDWSAARFTVDGPPLHRWALVRVLRERYRVVDVRSGPPAEGALHVEAATAKQEGEGSVALAAVSLLSFGAVPGTWSDVTPLRYTLAGAGTPLAEAAERLTERSVSWAPFALVGPTLLVGLNGGVMDVALERAAAAEALAARALAAFEPAVAAQLAAREGAPSGAAR